MLNSGYEGAREITKRLRNTMGWSATSGDVDNFVRGRNDVFIADPEMQKRLLDTNPNAARDMITTSPRPTAAATGTPPRRTSSASRSSTRRSRTASRASAWGHTARRGTHRCGARIGCTPRVGAPSPRAPDPHARPACARIHRAPGDEGGLSPSRNNPNRVVEKPARSGARRPQGRRFFGTHGPVFFMIPRSSIGKRIM